VKVWAALSTLAAVTLFSASAAEGDHYFKLSLKLGSSLLCTSTLDEQSSSRAANIEKF
jgi:hypothetical protein